MGPIIIYLLIGQRYHTPGVSLSINSNFLPRIDIAILSRQPATGDMRR